MRPPRQRALEGTRAGLWGSHVWRRGRLGLQNIARTSAGRDTGSMAFFANLFGGGAKEAPKPAKNTRLVDAMGCWSAAVKIAGQETEIFKVEHQVGKTTCFIAAEEGKEFEVQIESLRQPGTDEGSWLSVDGTQCVHCVPGSLDTRSLLLYAGAGSLGVSSSATTGLTGGAQPHTAANRFQCARSDPSYSLLSP